MLKKTTIYLLVLLLVGLLLSGCGTTTENQAKDKEAPATQDKKAILVVSFGTSYPDARKACIESTENKIKDTFKDYQTFRAFTSNIIIKKLADRDKLAIDTPEQALTKLQKEGYQQVVVQPLHIIPGEEFNDLKAVVDKFSADKAFDQIVLGRPLLGYQIDPNDTKDFDLAIDALKKQLPPAKEKQLVVFMGHGTEHQANAAYQLINDKLKQAGLTAIVGTVEGTPTLADVKAALAQQQVQDVILMPLMLVAGDHANNDMAGDEEDSWKTQLKKEGYTVTPYLHGLGENEAIQDIFVQHTRDAMAQLTK